MFHINEGRTDRLLRAGSGIALFLLGGLGVVGGVLGTAMLVVGGVLVVTAVVGWCPLYALLGVNTCPRDPHERHGVGMIRH